MTGPRHTLPPAAEASILKAVNALGPVHGPLPVIVASDSFAFLVDNWMAHMNAIGIDKFLVVAMDEAMQHRLERAGIEAGRADFDGSKSDFWTYRMLVWDLLIRHDIEIVQSDIDALWLKNPIPEYFSSAEFDIIWSQGTYHPTAVLERWGFVLCTGLFWARPTAGSKQFFIALTDQSWRIREGDDQDVINRLLLERGTVWEVPSSGIHQMTVRGHTFTGYRDLVIGRCDQLGLKMAMLPHDLFPRLTTAESGPYVKHVLRSPDPVQRVPELRAANCWMLDEQEGRLGTRQQWAGH